MCLINKAHTHTNANAHLQVYFHFNIVRLIQRFQRKINGIVFIYLTRTRFLTLRVLLQSKSEKNGNKTFRTHSQEAYRAR